MGKILLTIYLIGFAVILVVFTVSHDQKLTKWQDRLLLAFIAGLLWPLMVVLGLAREFTERTGIEERKDRKMRKRHVLMWRLLGNHPDYKKSRDSVRLQKKFVLDYMEKFYPEGIELYNDSSVPLNTFARWVKENVHVAVHEHGLADVTWYATEEK